MMRLSSAIAVLMIVVAAASAGLYPATMGSKGAAVGRTKSGKNRDTSGDSFHVQSPDGQYVFGHTNGEQGRAEMRDSDGTVTGYYSYADRDGRVVRVDYVADKGGYRVVSNAGVQSASVTVEDNGSGAGPAAKSDFRKLYSDLTRRIKSTVVERGQKMVEPVGEGQQPVVVDPISYPTEETKHSNHEEKDQFPDWNQVKISTTQKPTDGIKHDEGQQQQQQPQQHQETVDPNLDSVKITTQKSNIKGNDNNGQELVDDFKNGIITTEMPSVPFVPIQPQIKGNDNNGQELVDDFKNEILTTEVPSIPFVPIQPQIKGNDNNGQELVDDFKNGIITTEMPSIPFVPIQPQVPTRGDNKGGYSDTVFQEDHAKEITTEIGNSMIGVESTVIDDTENNSPVTKPMSITNNVQTTVSYNDGRVGQTTESSDGRLDFQTTVSGVKKFDEYSTAVISESATEHYQTIKEDNEYKIKIPSETDVLVTIKPLQDNESFENVPTTVEPSRQTDVQTTGAPSNVDYTTIETVNGSPAVVSTLRPLYESEMATSQTGGRVGDTETATAVDASGIEYVTEQNNNNEDRPEFRTLEPTESIGTTIRPDFEHSQQEQEIVWPEIPQDPVPQVLVPLDPYPAEEPRPKNSGVKTRPNDSRPVRHYRPDELKSAVNVSETETTTLMSIDEENGAMFNFPKYYLIG